jgi:type I restriction enzyme S subunit
MLKEKMLVPQLRFPEFEGEWVEYKLDSLLKFKNGINASKEDYGYGYKFINVLDIIQNDFITYDKIRGEVNVSKEIFEKNLVQYGDILFQRSSETRDEVGQSNVYLDKDNNATFGGFVIRGKKIGSYEPFFFHLLLKSSTARQEITTKSGGSTRFNVGQDILSSIKLLFPILKEQQKIANFLTAIDNRIQTLEKKKTLLEQYKKGVMQKIFKQELRFKDDTSTSLSKSDGKAFPEWGEKKLVNILTEFNEKSVISNQHPILSSTTKGLFKQSDYFTRDIASKDNTGYKILRKQQLVFSPQNLWLGNINVNCDFEVGIVSPSYKVFDFNKNLTSFIYCKYLLFTNRMFYEYAQASEQGASVVRRNLDMSSFKAIPIKLPSKEEQTKIANFLSSIDKNIALVAKKIEHTKTYKKGLLQQMFV